MDAIRKSPNYAEGQIRVLLNDLKNANHTIRIKAVKRFQDYISTYRPQIFDDDVDFLFCGSATEDGDGVPMGLLYYSGLDSGEEGISSMMSCQMLIAPTCSLYLRTGCHSCQ
jgi:hypothetical protein